MLKERSFNMKKISIGTLIWIGVMLCGCSPCTGCKATGDNKPVAPETYQDGGDQKGDPQLPEQKPWWKF